MCRTIIVIIAAASLSITVVGCTHQKLKAKGRLLVKGQPMVLKEGESVNVVFVPILPDGKPPRDHYWAIYNPEDATFWAAGKDREGLPPGKYRIAVAHQLHKQDLLKGQFDENRSKFVFDIDANTTEITIDLADQSRR
jgi:hypothetical protein